MEGFNLQSKDLKLNDLKARTIMQKAEKKSMELEEVYRYMSKAIEADDTIKSQENAFSKLSPEERKTKDFYRKNFEFYYSVIRKNLLAEGIETYRKIDDGVEILDVDKVARYIASGYVGFDCLEEAMEDPGVTDIYCISWNTIFVERNGKNERYNRRFRSEYAYNNFIDRMLRVAGKALDSSENKIVDFEIYGNRGNVINDMIATKGRCLTLRKHQEDPITLENMLEQKVMDIHIADMLGLFIQGETNMIYAGITGSGKTTAIRALLDHYISMLHKRALVLEDTQELFLKNPHTVDLTTFIGNDEKNNVTLRDLNITALRMKPKYIIVGEVRGAEAESAVEGMETGHSTIFTMHGGNVWNVINRLVTKYLMQMPTLGMEVAERIIGAAINFVAIQDDIPGIGRKVTSIHEIGYDFENRRVTAEPIVKYDIRKSKWIWYKTIGDEAISTMSRRGVPMEKIDKMNSYIESMIKGNSEQRS